jgi:DNA-binding transcriptional LysR family regulator
MDRVALTYLLAVVEYRNMSRAAIALHVTQSTLSKSIASLERQLGVRLLDRGSRGVVPTEAGIAVQARAKEILAGFDALVRDAHRTGTATAESIRVGFTATLSAVPCIHAIARMIEAHPDLEVTAWAVDSIEYAAQLVQRGECDVVIMGALQRPSASTNLRIELLHHDDLVVLARTQSPFQRLARVGHENLSEERFIAEPRGSLLRQILDDLRPHGLRIAVDLITRQALVQLVRSGGGSALVPRRFAHQHDLTGLIIRELEPNVSVGLWMITREIATDSVQAFRRVALDGTGLAA